MNDPQPGAAQTIAAPADVLAFWRGIGPENWYTRNPEVDAAILGRFAATYEAAAGALADWEASADAALALVIALDQFPRNMFRASPRAFAADPLARAVAARAVEREFDRGFDAAERRLFYLPFMHSEDLADQEVCIALCRAADDREGVMHAEIHAAIIRRFGRFPHRNLPLGRTTTPEEQAFLRAGGFAG